MNPFNPSDMDTDNLDARNADWEDYAAHLDNEPLYSPLEMNTMYEDMGWVHDDAEEFELNQLAMDNEFEDDADDFADELESDMYGMDYGYDGYFSDDEFGF